MQHRQQSDLQYPLCLHKSQLLLYHCELKLLKQLRVRVLLVLQEQRLYVAVCEVQYVKDFGIKVLLEIQRLPPNHYLRKASNQEQFWLKLAVRFRAQIQEEMQGIRFILRMYQRPDIGRIKTIANKWKKEMSKIVCNKISWFLQFLVRNKK